MVQMVEELKEISEEVCPTLYLVNQFNDDTGDLVVGCTLSSKIADEMVDTLKTQFDTEDDFEYTIYPCKLNLLEFNDKYYVFTEEREENSNA